MMKNKIIKNIPNMLTISRMVSSVLGAGFFVFGNIHMSAILYIYGAISDCFDGLAARKLNAFSELGRKLDALSDKLYAASLLIPSIICGNFLMIIPSILELKISSINLKSQKLGFETNTQRIGKFKTALLFPTMIVGLLATKFIDFYPLLIVLFPISTILQINSITVYENLLNHNIKLNKEISTINNKEEIEVDKNKIKNKKTSKIKSHSESMNPFEELALYIMTPYFKQDYVKEKKRVK